VGSRASGYDYAATHFTPFLYALPDMGKRLAFLEGNQALAMARGRRVKSTAPTP